MLKASSKFAATSVISGDRIVGKVSLKCSDETVRNELIILTTFSVSSLMNEVFGRCRLELFSKYATK